MSIIRKIVDQWSSLFRNGSAVPAERQLFRKKFLAIFFTATIIICIISVYAQVLSYPRYSPEWSLFYKWNYNLSWKDILALYNPFANTLGGGFYRPTAFVAFYQIVTRFIDWHNIFAFQILGIMMLVFNSIFIYFFARQLFKDEITPILTSILSFVHPVFFILIHNLFMTDFLYQILTLWVCIIFCGNFLERKNAPLWILIAMVLYVLSMTSKEQAIGLSAFLCGFVFLERVFNRSAAILGNKLFRNRLILALLALFLTILYLVIYLSRYQDLVSGGEYRTGLNPGIIINNILSGSFWLSHIFLITNKTWPLFRVHNTIINNAYGFLILTAVVYYISACIMRKEKDEMRTLSALLFFVIGFMVLPVYSGGRPWHFALPAVAVMMIYSRFLSRVLERITVRAAALMALCLAVIVPMSLSAVNFSRDMDRVDEYFKLNSEALLHPPLPSSSIPEGSCIVYYPSQARWLYGGGYMFSFVYKRGDIIELAIPDMEKMTPEEALVLYSKAHLFYFEYDRNSKPRWQDKSAQFRARLLEKVPPGRFSSRVH